MFKIEKNGKVNIKRKIKNELLLFLKKGNPLINKEKFTYE